MSILQQGDSQGQLCLADLCEEGVAVRGGMKGVARRRGWETILYHTPQGRIRIGGICYGKLCYKQNDTSV